MPEDIRSQSDAPIQMDHNEALRQPPAEEMQFLMEMEQAANQEHVDVIEENVDRLQRLVNDCQNRMEALGTIQNRARMVMGRFEPAHRPNGQQPGPL